ncbi:hypothetical protein UP12_19665 (plasmid) [Bacillus pumilus]|uniref:antitoxin VbhA family protein n=1 Tax=Bacillus pumilus TaxID=1408 RepID=UPI0007769EEC|nr:hypothetical protein [Bacillus pumilus]AMM99623.1 hypothetical protein UP12_19665 [Bacillus pumilus]
MQKRKLSLVRNSLGINYATTKSAAYILADQMKRFNKYFNEVNATMGFEGLSLDNRDKDLLKKWFTGEITEEEYNKRSIQK